jgi:hypothetical protein
LWQLLKSWLQVSIENSGKNSLSLLPTSSRQKSLLIFPFNQITSFQSSIMWHYTLNVLWDLK